MQRIGLLGGMSWESSAQYYALLNQGIAKRLGGMHSAELVMLSVDFAEICRLQEAGDWQQSAALLSQGAQQLCAAGADFVLICTNTMHKVAPEIQAAIDVPVLHIADVTADALAKQHISKVALLGTRYTMQLPFYREHLAQRDIQVLLPTNQQQTQVHNIIYQQLCKGQIRQPDREYYQQVIQQLAEQGAQGVILGCTEIQLLIQQQHSPIPLFDTTALHVEAAIERALALGSGTPINLED